MKALSVWQPWASLLASGAKKYETRSWATHYRGPIAIHAAALNIRQILKKCFPLEDWEYHPDHRARVEFLDALGKVFGVPSEDVMAHLEKLPTGAVIATAELVNVLRIVYHPGPDINEAKHILVGAESLSTDKHAPDFGYYIAPTEQELMFGNWTPGRYAWEFANVKLITPVPARGHQGLWEWSDGMIISCK